MPLTRNGGAKVRFSDKIARIYIRFLQFADDLEVGNQGFYDTPTYQIGHGAENKHNEVTCLYTRESGKV